MRSVSSALANTGVEPFDWIGPKLRAQALRSENELLARSTEDQWNCIKKEINESDYFVARYRAGFLAADSNSHLEMEFDFAVDHGQAGIDLSGARRVPGYLIVDRATKTEN
jgi:hypothetical protein